MRLSHLTVCVDYVDYLSVSHHHNAGQFDDYTVVTAPRDASTQAWCAKNGVNVVVTDAFYRNGAVFNKGLGLSEGLNALAHGGDKPLEWIAIMDADTFVAPDFRAQIDSMVADGRLDKEWMYGARRIMVPTWDDYQGLWTRDLESYRCPDGFGFGWLQLCHWDSAAMKACLPGEWYPSSRDCTECDWSFRNRWGDFEVPYTVPRGKLAELPFRVFNIGPDGQNHGGRRSQQFVPPLVDNPMSPSLS